MVQGGGLPLVVVDVLEEVWQVCDLVGDRAVTAWVDLFVLERLQRPRSHSLRVGNCPRRPDT